MSEYADRDHMSALVFGQAARIGYFHADGIAESLGVPLETVETIRQELRDLGLLQPSAHNPELLIPVHPDVAATELTSPAEHEIRQLRAGINEVKLRLGRLTPAFSEGRRQLSRARRGFEPITATGQIKWVLKEQFSECRSEILISGTSVPVPEDILEIVREKLREASRRGIRIRVLCSHATFADPAALTCTAELAALGASIRSRPEVAGRLVIVDREFAVVFNEGLGAEAGAREDTDAHATDATAGDGPATRPTGPTEACEDGPMAVTINEPTTLTALGAGFDLLWQDAKPFGEGTARNASVTDDLKVAIVRLLAQGHKDEVVARRLGLSVRQCRRYVKEIMDELDAASRFQAGAKLALAGSVTWEQTDSDVA